MGGHHAPPALNHELHKKRTHDQPELVWSIGPEWNDRSAQRKGSNDCSPPAPFVGKMSNNDASNNGPDPGKRSDCRPPCRTEMPLALQEGGVHVLRAVRYKEHHRHEKEKIEKQLPVREDFAALFAPRLLLPRPVLPHGRFVHAEPDEQQQENRGQTSNKKKRAPAYAAKEEEEADRSEHIARSVTFLKQS